MSPLLVRGFSNLFARLSTQLHANPRNSALPGPRTPKKIAFAFVGDLRLASAVPPHPHRFVFSAHAARRAGGVVPSRNRGELPMAGNGYDRAVLERLLSEIDDCDNRLASLKGDYMASCRGPRQDIAAVFEQAKDSGMPIRAFKALVKNRRLDRKIAANVARLEDDDAAEYDRIIADLGDFVDLPLGQAALRRAKPSAHEASLDSLA